MKNAARKKQNQEAQKPQQPRQGVPFLVVNGFVDDIQLLNSGLSELALMAASGDGPLMPALLSLLSEQYEKATRKFIEESMRTKLPLVETGGAK